MGRNQRGQGSIIEAGVPESPGLSNNLRHIWWHLHKLSGWGKAKGRSPVPWEVWELRPAWPKCPVGTEGGKPRPDNGLPNLAPC